MTHSSKDGTGGGARRRAYIGSFTEAGGPGLTVAEVEPGTGALKVVHATDAVANPSYLALSPGGDVLYAVSETEEGAVAAFSLADPVRPELLGGPVPVRGDGPTHLAVAGARLLTANYGSGSVSALRIRTGGLPGEPVEVFAHRGSGPVADRQAGPHAHCVVPDPSGRWVLSADLGTDAVWIYALEPPAGAPRPAGRAPLRPGSGPRHLVFHPRGDRAYVLNELAPTVTICHWDAATGTLRALDEMRVVPPDAGTGTYPSAPVVSADGRFLWAANRGDDSIATLALDASGDAAVLRGTVPCGGHWPRDLGAHPDGGVLYAANERSGEVVWFTVDTQTGIPAFAGSVAVAAASCVVVA
ncbi:lactonase family protein [Streptomyces sp. NPDC049585]|uniref:lactonase family protein n=1 Tax=Streptomyces sp. NPDC049585 TaxID=3155154 RepID=UPI00341A8AEE